MSIKRTGGRTARQGVTSIPIQSTGKRLPNIGTPVALSSAGGRILLMRPRSLLLPSVLVLALFAGGVAHAGDLRITLPKRTKPTKVQKLNQEGVRALKKHRYEEARKLFYQAYLIDPDDPFTLNNLGYVSELSGELDRATRFYDLAAENKSDATIAHSTAESLKGKKVDQVAGKAADKQMEINRYNVEAMGLLEKGRTPEADLTLEKALRIDPQNPFTLNNLGYTKEKEGELERALVFYSQAANTGSRETVVVALDQDWRGKAISEVAAENARKLRRLMAKEDTPEARVARLNLEGVSAMNRNDRAAALKYFREAYRLDQNNAFTLNNMGYVAEMEGDRETADFYYAKAAEAQGRDARVTVATRRDAEGKPVGQVADMGGQAVSARMEELRAAREREGGPIVLMNRNNTPVIEPAKPPAPAPENESPENNAPPAGIMEPLPDNQQPPAAQGSTSNPAPTSQPAANPGEVMQPLPDNQQPPAAKSGQPNQAPAKQPSGGVIPPLPDNQQPPSAQQPPPPKK